jgi:peroxiredoxin
MMLPWFALAGRVLLALVLLTSGFAKLVDQRGSRDAVTQFGIPRRLAGLIAIALPIFEIVVAVGLLPTATAFWATVAVGVLLAVFSGALIFVLSRGRRPACHCFGQIRSRPVGPLTVVRNAALLVVTFFVIWAISRTPALSAINWLTVFRPIELVSSLLATAATTVAAAVGWLALNLLRQQGRMLARIESLESARDLGRGPGPTSGRQMSGLPIGSAAPKFVLRDLRGETVSLDLLRATGAPVMLVFIDPDCGPCTALLPDIAHWQHKYVGQLTVALLSAGTCESNQAKVAQYRIDRVLIQGTDEIAKAYQYVGTPGAVIIDTTGRVASPVASGAESIRALVQRTVASHAAPSLHSGSPTPSSELPDPASQAVQL